jgi:hypothetical protein
VGKILRGKIVLAVYSDTMEFGELGTDIDTKLSLIHTTIDKKYPLCSRSITTNSWKYEIPFVGGSDFIVKVLELSKILCDKQESFSDLKQNNDYNIRFEFNIHTAIEQVGYMLDAETMSNLARLGLHCDFKITLVGEGEFGRLLSTTLPSR